MQFADLTRSDGPAQPGMAEGAAATFDHEFPSTRYTIEISRLAPQLSGRQQKLALEVVREMAGKPDAEA